MMLRPGGCGGRVSGWRWARDSGLGTGCSKLGFGSFPHFFDSRLAEGY